MPAPFFASAIFAPMKAQIHSGRGEQYRCAQCTVVHCSLLSPTSYLLLFSAVGGGLEVLRTYLCLLFFVWRCRLLSCGV